MANTTDYEVPVSTSSSAMTAIEDAIRSLRLTRDEGQDFVRAFVQLVDRSTGSPRRSNPPVIFDRPTSPISANYDIVGFEGYPNGEEDLNVAPKEARLDDDGAGDMHPRLPPQCPTCASRSIAATSVNVAAATRGPASASVAAATPVNASPSTTATTPIAAPPATGLAAAMLPSNTTDTASSTAVTSSAASTTAAVVAPAVTPARVPGPVYARLPLNAPSNAVLPPPHLVDAVYGYHIPGTTDSGPFYVITRGRNIGIFSGWETVSPLVTGVSHAVYSRVASLAEGHARMSSARTSAFALYLT